MNRLLEATRALAAGKPVLLYDSDSREGETDIVVASQSCTPEMMRLLRTDGGGLVCTTIAPEHHTLLGLPYLSDLLGESTALHPVLAGLRPNDIAYDASKPSFSLTINHRATFTGIPDADRSLTITELALFLRETQGMTPGAAQAAFGRSFRAPGHVILLNGHPQGLAARLGHTELSLELARQAGIVPSTTICEMLDPATGQALSRKGAEEYAKRNGLVFLTGQDVVDAWKTAQAPQRVAPTSAS